VSPIVTLDTLTTFDIAAGDGVVTVVTDTAVAPYARRWLYVSPEADSE
jgi:hypothetical protein